LVRLQGCPKAVGEVFNVGSTEEISILELAELVKRTLGSRSPVQVVPYNEAYAPGFQDMLRRKPVIDKLFKFSNFRPTTPLAEIIRRTAATIA